MEIPSEMQLELDKFNDHCEAATRQFIQVLEAKPPPPMIYHYTDYAGFRGILESGNLWLTDVFNLNDPSELKHGFSHAVDIINRYAGNGPLETKLFAKQFERLLVDDGIEAAAHYFVGCFSAACDDLGQWRAYADNGQGFALGFDTAILEDAFVKASAPDLFNNSTFHVTYSDVEAIKLHSNLIDKALPLISLPHGKKLSSEALGELKIHMWVHCLRAALFFKHEAYLNEVEYRFMQIHAGPPRPTPEVRYRIRPHELVRFREFDWRTAAPKSLKKIVIGPAANKTKATMFAKECLRSFRPGETVELATSTIPYRS